MKDDGIYKVDGGYIVLRGVEQTFHYSLRAANRRWGKNPPTATFPHET